MCDERKQIIIEKGIPIPPRPPSQATPGRNGSYATFLKMEPGDSIFFEGVNSAEAWRKVYYAVRYHYKKAWEITARDVCDGARVWRIK
jgi:hypothetical protein